jgi:predicted ATPase
MGRPIDKITLKAFKSIRDLEDFPLRNLNILTGANGAGKSNFVSFFTFLRETLQWLGSTLLSRGRQRRGS